MDLKKRYEDTVEWYKKALIMQMYHLQQKLTDKKWPLIKTANYFGVSVGLVSENLRLAACIDTYPELIKQESRQKALDVVERRKSKRIIEDEDDD